MHYSIFLCLILIISSCENKLTHETRTIGDVGEAYKLNINSNFSSKESQGESALNQYFDDTSLYLTAYSSNFDIELSDKANANWGYTFSAKALYSLVFTHDKPRPDNTPSIGYFDYGSISLSGVEMNRYHDDWLELDIYVYGLYYEADHVESLNLPFTSNLIFKNENSPEMAVTEVDVPVNPIDMINNKLRITNLDISKQYSFNDDLIIQLSRELPENNYFNFIIVYIDDLGLQSVAVQSLKPNVVTDRFLIVSEDLKRLKSEALQFMKEPDNWDKYGTGSPLSSFDENNLVYYIKTGQTYRPENKTFTFKTSDQQDTEYEIAVILNDMLRHQIKLID